MKQLVTQRRLAAELMKCGRSRVWFNPEKINDIREAITRADIRSLIKDSAIMKKPEKAISGFRRAKMLMQKRKGRRRGMGSRKGTHGARLKRKRNWINKVRVQREYVKNLKKKEAITKAIFNDIYLKIKGGFFRSKRHIILYLEERGLGKGKKHETETEKN